MIARRMQIPKPRRAVSAVVAATVMLLPVALMAPFAAAATPEFAAAATPVFGAIVWSPVKHTIGYATAASKAAAEANAVKDCHNKGGSANCVEFGWFEHAWGALATSSNGHVGFGWAWNTASSANAKRAADNSAVKYCTDVKGVNCRVAKDLATGGVPGRGTGGLGPYWNGNNGNWHYVALGDSYSAGYGNPAYPGDLCSRSPKAYGPQLRAAVPTLGVLSFIACSGAVTDDFESVAPPAKHPKPPKPPANLPQAVALGHTPNVLSVTMTVGGNDVGFAAIAKNCILTGNCRNDKQLVSDINGRLVKLATGLGTDKTPDGRPIVALTKLLQDVHAKAPLARIFVGGYPRLFGTTTATYHSRNGHYYCPVVGAYRVTYEDAQWLNKLADRTNRVLSDAVSKAGVPAQFVSVRKAFTYHGLCDASTPWLFPLTVHPTSIGQLQYMKNFRTAEGL